MRLGIDVSAQRIEVIAVAPDGVPTYRATAPTPRGAYAPILEAIVAAARAASAALGPLASIGLSVPGAHASPAALVKNANITELNGEPLWRDIEHHLGRRVRLANDANCFALSEARDGAGVGHALVFGVILDAGCGGGLVAHGHLITGHNGLTGEWGHNPLPGMSSADMPALTCYCGQQGCVETYVTAAAFAYDYLLLTGAAWTPAAVAAAAAAGNGPARLALARLEDRLARSLAGVINTLDPDCIVLGGELAGLGSLYDRVPKLWQQHVFGRQVTTALLPAAHGPASAVRGAALLTDADGVARGAA